MMGREFDDAFYDKYSADVVTNNGGWNARMEKATLDAMELDKDRLKLHMSLLKRFSFIDNPAFIYGTDDGDVVPNAENVKSVEAAEEFNRLLEEDEKEEELLLGAAGRFCKKLTDEQKQNCMKWFKDEEISKFLKNNMKEASNDTEREIQHS
ncbi:MAG: hypothetical protein IJ608_11935 [Lachnospiraceae bacterium]|nr:hypothetical protein [Lachnospiraceae bacterium]